MLSRDCFIRGRGQRPQAKAKAKARRLVKIGVARIARRKVPQMESQPQKRPIKIEAHILAYLGDLMTLFEESVKNAVAASATATATTQSHSNIQKREEPSPGVR